ncbi:hypothetical protein DS878_03640 [Marinobacter sp. F3R11]|nr:hypothetical protein DS878_03640 [Marinobacter sp. F3R11]
MESWYMKTISQHLYRVVSMISAAVYAVAGIIVLVMMLQIVADVFLRSFFDKPLMGSLEIVSNYYMVAFAFLPISLLVLRKEFVFVEVFTSRLPGSVNRGLDKFGLLLGVLVFLLIAISSGQYAFKKTLAGEYLDIVYYDLLIWPTRWIATLGFTVAVISAVTVLFVNYQSNKKSEHASDPE